MQLVISLAEQCLRLIEGEQELQRYAVSTAANGAGQRKGSYCTPLGRHRIRAKIGAGQPLYSVFVGRRPTGELYSDSLAAAQPDRDWILSRILWLGGLEPGFNRYGAVDTTWRYIYIHGSPDHLLQGQPASHGCIRMRNADVVALFDAVAVGCPVLITA
jgi:lipoprotein-anchoring transpeptidase ErfK/SrfK